MKPLKKKLKQLIFRLNSFLLKGSARTCPLCEKSFRKFLRHGIGKVKRPDAKCPFCRSLERHRALWLYIKDQKLLDPQIIILHCAPEPQFSRLISQMENVTYITTDYCMVESDLLMDLTQVGIKTACLDAVICNHVLEHIVEDSKAMTELARILKPGAWAIIQSPLDPNREETLEDPLIVSDQQREKIYGHFDHKRLYGRDYQLRLEAAGLKVHKSSFVKDLPASAIELYGLDASEDIYFCTK